MPILLLLLAHLLAFNAHSNAEFRSCRYKKIDGAINSGYHSLNYSSLSKVASVEASCRCETRCALTAQGSGLGLLVAPLSELLIDWLKPQLISSSAPSSSSYVRGNNNLGLERPKGLWLMDSVFGCRNLGTKGGTNLDCTGTGAKWTAQGPVAWSRVGYLRFTTNTNLRIQLKHGSFVFDFYKTFTFALWLKADAASVKTSMPIFDGMENNDIRMHFWFFDGLDRLYIRGAKTVKSSRISKGWSEWRHVVLINKNNAGYDTYLNGEKWPGNLDNTQSPAGQPHYLLLGYRPSNNKRFSGSMACIAFYERILSKSEVQTLMNNCP